MAAPSEKTTKDLNGVFVMNKTLSDDTDDIFVLQGLSWFTRKAINMATVTLKIKHYTDDAGVEHVDIQQVLSGGISGSDEMRTLDWEKRPHSDRIFGDVVGQSRRKPLADVDDPFQSQMWDESTKDTGVIESYVVNEKMKWQASQVWGFYEVDGARRYVRRLVFKSTKDGPEKRLEKQLVYDYQGKLEG